MKAITKISAVAILTIGMLFGVVMDARAYLMTQTFSYSGSPATLADIPWTYDFDLNKINLLSGQTLNSVEVVVNSALISQVGVQNTGGSSLTVRQAGTSMSLWLTDNSAPSTVLNDTFGANPFGTPMLSITKNNSRAFVLGVGKSTNYTLSATSTITNNLTSNLGEFIGTGIIPLDVFAAQGTSWNVSGSGSESQSSLADFTMQVTYNYSGSAVAVPEPSAGILIGVGGLICWGWRKRKAASKA